MSDGITEDFLEDASGRMQKSVEATRGEFATVRTGRASPHLLDRIQVDYYGTVAPLKTLAQISASTASMSAGRSPERSRSGGTSTRSR